MTSRVKGAAGVRRLLRQLPETAREGMAAVLDDYGAKVLVAMRQDVPEQTGLLRSRLSKTLNVKSLRLKIGFVGKRANGRVTRKVNGKRRKINDQFVGGQFYGRFVEFGRKAQTVTVRRRKGGRGAAGAGRSRSDTIAATYQLRVRAMAARPFIFKKRPALRSQLSASLNSFWDNVLTSAASGAGFDD